MSSKNNIDGKKKRTGLYPIRTEIVSDSKVLDLLDLSYDIVEEQGIDGRIICRCSCPDGCCQMS